MSTVAGSWAWARAEIRGRWRGLLAVGLLIAVMAGASMTALAGARRTSTSYDRLRSTTLAHDALVTADDAGALEAVADLPSVTAASVGTIYPAFLDVESEFDIGVFASHDDRLGRDVDVGRLLTGRRSRPDRAEEVVVNPRAADTLGVGPGDVVRLTTITPEQKEQILAGTFEGPPAGPVLSLRVTGIVRNADDLRGDQADNAVLAGSAFRERYEGAVGRFTDYGVYRIRGGANAFPAFAAESRRLIGTEGEVGVVGAQEVSGSVRDALKVLTTALVALALAALLVALVVGPQSLGRQLAAVAVDRPVLEAMGMTRRGRAAAGVMTAMPVAVAAGIGAAGFAIATSPFTPVNLGRQAEPDPGLAVDPLVHGLGAAVTACVVLVVAQILSWRLARRVEEVSPTAARPTSTTRLAAALGMGPSAVTGVRMALERGAGRSAIPVRSALIASVAAAAGLAGTLTFAASLDRLIDQPARYGSPWDLQPDLYSIGTEELDQLDDASDVGLLHRSTVEVEDGGGAIAYAMDRRKGEPTLTVLEGRMPFGPDEAALGRDVMQRLDRGVGDRFGLRVGGERRSFRIVGTVVAPAADQEPVAGAVVLTVPALEEVRLSDVSTNAVLRWRPGADRSAAERRFRAAFEGALSAYSRPRPPGEVVNLGRVGSLPAVFGAFLAIVGGAALLHALATSTRRRRHDLAVLRVVGFVRRQVGATLAWQATTIAVVGLVIGIPLGIAVGRWLWILVADGIGVATDPIVPLVAGALVVLGTVAVANLLALPLAARAARIAPGVVLRAE